MPFRKLSTRLLSVVRSLLTLASCVSTCNIDSSFYVAKYNFKYKHTAEGGKLIILHSHVFFTSASESLPL